ncbi:MAG TPA: hypothetical protein VET65_09030 [Candidatus Limnocylindrales bacterium]|nr:hypothetical protein [Candidatus Limnocylindrales bacterium]
MADRLLLSKNGAPERQPGGGRRRLMPGEDESSTVLQDAEHWINVYAELLAFSRKVAASIRTAGESLDGHSPDGQATDLDLLHAHLVRMEERLAYWTARRAALQGATSA